jgi:signal transduction histidine kinase
VGAVYGIGILLAIAQALQLLPSKLYLLAFILALGGSLILLLIHLWRQPLIRRDFRLLMTALILAIAPPLLWEAIDSIFNLPAIWGGLGLVSLPLLSSAYLYTAFRRRLGDLELRVNRFFTVYLFLILLGLFGLLFIASLDRMPEAPGKTTTIGFTTLLLTVAALLWAYPVFETFMDQRVFGISLTPKRLLEAFSSEITTSVSLPELIRVLQEQVFPSLLIRQFAFLHYEQGSLHVLSTMGLGAEMLPSQKDVPDLLTRSGFYRSLDLGDADQPYAWIRLILPLRLSDQLIGFWLLGRRDPDDFYSQQEISILISLANLTAIALSNILQTERLTSVYQANINRYEEERVHWARDLHDIILNELAALPIRSDAPGFSPTFQEAYERVSEQLRDIVYNLRPPMLAFGLKLALETYAENLRERNPESPEIMTNIQADGDCRYSLLVESNVYRIVQEACENSLRHAHANRLSITGSLTEKETNLNVEDSGKGIDPQINLKLDVLLIHKHFGLAGMRERASVIGAELDIVSKANEGTQIHIGWKRKDAI